MAGVGTAFAESYRVVLYDLVGSGASDLAAYDRTKYDTLQGHADDVLEIIDEFAQGPIRTELMRVMFEPMVRGADRAPSEGVGLGLFIVREIAHSHGGTVAVQSDAETGTTFVVEFSAEGEQPAQS